MKTVLNFAQHEKILGAFQSLIIFVKSFIIDTMQESDSEKKVELTCKTGIKVEMIYVKDFTWKIWNDCFPAVSGNICIELN